MHDTPRGGGGTRREAILLIVDHIVDQITPVAGTRMRQ